MSGDDQDTALERIERALTRIETAAMAYRNQGADSSLPVRHARLRAQVEQAIASLDDLIAEADTNESRES